MSLIEAKLKLTLQDGARRFELDLQLDSEGPVLALFGASGSGATDAQPAAARWPAAADSKPTAHWWPHAV